MRTMTLDPRNLVVPAPTPTAESEVFWNACRQERLLLQRCTGCGRWVFYPRAFCPFCWSDALQWLPASGAGRVRGFTVVHKPGHPGWLAAVPYTVAVIRLAEGPTMLSALMDVDPHGVSVGMPVHVRFCPVGDFTLPFFAPDPTASGRLESLTEAASAEDRRKDMRS